MSDRAKIGLGLRPREVDGYARALASSSMPVDWTQPIVCRMGVGGGGRAGGERRKERRGRGGKSLGGGGRGGRGEGDGGGQDKTLTVTAQRRIRPPGPPATHASARFTRLIGDRLFLFGTHVHQRPELPRCAPRGPCIRTLTPRTRAQRCYRTSGNVMMVGIMDGTAVDIRASIDR